MITRIKVVQVDLQQTRFIVICKNKSKLKKTEIETDDYDYYYYYYYYCVDEGDAS